MANQANEERELTVDELDVGDMVMNMALRIGAAWSMTSELGASGDAGTERFRELEARLWNLIPFTKALAQVALENPGRTRELWAKALREPMPFGGEAIGMPTVANPADRAAGKGD